MKWTVLSDNRTNNDQLETEHGLSILFETEKHRRHFMSINDKAKVIVSPNAMSGKFFSKRGNLHGITAEWPKIDDDRLVLTDQTCTIAENIHVIAHIPQNHPMPKGNQNLFVQNTTPHSDQRSENTVGDFIHDDFRHELALYVDGLLFTGCAHSGLENRDVKGLAPVILLP